MLSYDYDYSYLDEYPYNTVVKLEIDELSSTNSVLDSFECTATALSDIVLVTAAHCAKPSSKDRTVRMTAYYGYDGYQATAGSAVSRCVAWYNDETEVDNAIVVLKTPMKLPRYMSYDYVTNLPAASRRNAATYMLAFPADEAEMDCLPYDYYYGMVETRGTSANLNYRKGAAINRCERDKYSIWATGSMIGGQSGGCLVHSPSGCCIGTAAYTCEVATECSRKCPNAWGGFNRQYPLIALWEDCLP